MALGTVEDYSPSTLEAKAVLLAQGSHTRFHLGAYFKFLDDRQHNGPDVQVPLPTHFMYRRQ